jgi:hypothetical protein
MFEVGHKLLAIIENLSIIVGVLSFSLYVYSCIVVLLNVLNLKTLHWFEKIAYNFTNLWYLSFMRFNKTGRTYMYTFTLGQI